MASFHCYDNSDVIVTLIITNFHLYLIQLWCTLIFPNLCLWRRSLRSNLGGIDLEKLYQATLKRQEKKGVDNLETGFSKVFWISSWSVNNMYFWDNSTLPLHIWPPQSTHTLYWGTSHGKTEYFSQWLYQEIYPVKKQIIIYSQN